MNLDALSDMLVRYGVPIERWGKGEAKTVEELYLELTARECQIAEERGSMLTRTVGAAGVNVFYRHAGRGLLRLRESEQRFKDGRVRRRQLHASLNEKLGGSEDPLAAAERALAEEIGVHSPAALFTRGTKVLPAESSRSYPGLVTTCTMHFFDATIRGDDFRPEGYVERQATKSTFFVWEPVS